jgi:hypothetical protein
MTVARPQGMKTLDLFLLFCQRQGGALFHFITFRIPFLKRVILFITDRVTRLCEFLPTGRLFSLCCLDKITCVAHICDQFFSWSKSSIIFDKKCAGLHYGRLFHNRIRSPWLPIAFFPFRSMSHFLFLASLCLPLLGTAQHQTTFCPNKLCPNWVCSKFLRISFKNDIFVCLIDEFIILKATNGTNVNDQNAC